MPGTAGTVKLVVVGSLALDDIATPTEARQGIVGGAVSFACAAASFFARAGMVAVAGDDFPAVGQERFRRLGIDLRGLHRAAGKTFHWSGVYEQDLNVRRTLATDLNVFADFAPELPSAYRRAPFLFLANIAPELQLRVLSQVRRPRFVAADTMDLWIQTARAALGRVLARVDLVLLNESEARQLTGETHLVRAARRVQALGPRHVIIKQGEHGCLLAARSALTLLPAFPVENVQDPTGAGDAFAGGLLGALAAGGQPTAAALRRALVSGTVAASFAVESFGLDRLAALKRRELDARLAEFRAMVSL